MEQYEVKIYGYLSGKKKLLNSIQIGTDSIMHGLSFEVTKISGDSGDDRLPIALYFNVGGYEVVMSPRNKTVSVGCAEFTFDEVMLVHKMTQLPLSKELRITRIGNYGGTLIVAKDDRRLIYEDGTILFDDLDVIVQRVLRYYPEMADQAERR